jgi:hypothetical protein
MNLASVDSFIKLFGYNLRYYQRIAITFDLGHAARSVKYTKNVLSNWPQVFREGRRPH